MSKADLLVSTAREGDLEQIQELVELGIDIDGKDQFGRTALHMSSANGEVEIVNYLLEKGANPLIANDEGNTALHWASMTDEVEICKILLKTGADPYRVNKHGRSAYDEALSYEDLLDLFQHFNQQDVPKAQQLDMIDEDTDENKGQEYQQSQEYQQNMDVDVQEKDSIP